MMCLAISLPPSLVIVPKDKNYSNEQIEALTEFQEKYFNHIIIR